MNKKNIKFILIFVIVICVISVGAILISIQPWKSKSVEINLNDDLIALGDENISASTLQLLSEGKGTIEVIPYKANYSLNEPVKLVAHSIEGWTFDHWEGDISMEDSTKMTVKIKMPIGNFKVVAVFVQN